MAAPKKPRKPSVTTDNAFRTNITQLVSATGSNQMEVGVKITPDGSGELSRL